MQTVAENGKLMAEWDEQKNTEAGLDPKVLTYGSNKKAWWICQKGHSYQKTISKRTLRGDGCPICSNHLVVAGINDFKSNYPLLMLDWDYSKNQDIDPSRLSVRSITQVHWKCHICGYEWEACIGDAVRKAINCPKCSSQARGNRHHLYFLRKNGCLSDENLLKDWDYDKNTFLPETVTAQCNRYAYWKCHICGYEWQAKINNRSNGRGCPFCSNRTLVPGKNDLGTTHPALAKEWHPTKNADLSPADVTYGMSKKVWWLCPNGHEYQATVLHRASTNGTNCPICNSGRQTSFREQALFYYVKKLFPNAISRYKPENFERFELDIYIPDWCLAIEYDGVAWHKDGNFDRERRKYQLCRARGIKLIRVKEKMPEEGKHGLADEIISTDDFETEQGFTQVIHFVLAKIYMQGFYWMHAVDVNLSRDRFDIMKYATEIKHSFQDAYPDLAKEWHPTKNKNLKPSMFKPKSDFKAWWRCPLCGNEYEQSLYLRASGCGCPVCAKDKQVKTLRENLIKKNGSISNPVLLKEWNCEKNGELKPENFTRAADQKVWWKCAVCGHEWQAKISNREHGRGCPKCADTKLFIGENDLATIHPELLAEWDYAKNKGIDPHAIHHGSNRKVWWKCSTCGYEYQAPIARRDKGSGCRKCADKANPDLIRATILKKRGSIGDVCPDLIPEYSLDNTISIFEIASTSHQKVKWVCSKCGHQWEAAPYTRKAGHGCAVCGRIKSAQSRRKNRQRSDNQ